MKSTTLFAAIFSILITIVAAAPVPCKALRYCFGIDALANGRQATHPKLAVCVKPEAADKIHEQGTQCD